MLPLFKHFTNFAALADKFPGIGYVDMRHSRPPTGDFLQGVSIGQSCAINYYVASICNLLGKNSTETALVLSFSAHVQV
jgi:hypothetical protein